MLRWRSRKSCNDFLLLTSVFKFRPYFSNILVCHLDCYLISWSLFESSSCNESLFIYLRHWIEVGLGPLGHIPLTLHKFDLQRVVGYLLALFIFGCIWHGALLFRTLLTCWCVSWNEQRVSHFYYQFSACVQVRTFDCYFIFPWLSRLPLNILLTCQNHCELSFGLIPQTKGCLLPIFICWRILRWFRFALRNAKWYSLILRKFDLQRTAGQLLSIIGLGCFLHEIMFALPADV